MTQQDAFVQKLSALLNDAPASYGLREYQALYRQLIFTFGLRILQAFPLQAGLDWGATGGQGAGPHPKIGGGEGTGAGTDTGGQGAGPHPSDVGRFLAFPAFVLNLTP